MNKCWKKTGMQPHGRAIYGVNGNYIWENKKGVILELSKVMGGGTAINLYYKTAKQGIGKPHTLPQSGIGFKHRRIALKYAKQYMEQHC